MYFAWNPVIGGGVRGLFRDDIFLHQYVSFIWNQKHVSVKWHIFFSENDALEVFGIFAWCKSQLFLCGVPGSMNFQMWVMAWYSGQPWSNTAGVRAQCGLLIVCWNKKEPKTAPNQEVLLTDVHATPPWAMMLCPCFFSWNIITISVIFVELQNWPPCKLMTCLVYIWMSGN